MLAELRRRRYSTATGIGGLALMAALAVSVAPVVAAPAGPGNSPNAEACQKGGWMTLVREDGTAFTSGGTCTSYAAKGGTLFRTSEVPCLNGGYDDYVTTDGLRFGDQAACVTYVRDGGTLTPRNLFREACEAEDYGTYLMSFHQIDGTIYREHYCYEFFVGEAEKRAACTAMGGVEFTVWAGGYGTYNAMCRVPDAQ